MPESHDLCCFCHRAASAVLRDRIFKNAQPRDGGSLLCRGAAHKRLAGDASRRRSTPVMPSYASGFKAERCPSWHSSASFVKRALRASAVRAPQVATTQRYTREAAARRVREQVRSRAPKKGPHRDQEACCRDPASHFWRSPPRHSMPRRGTFMVFLMEPGIKRVAVTLAHHVQLLAAAIRSGQKPTGSVALDKKRAPTRALGAHWPLI